jgi:hypothetical protein
LAEIFHSVEDLVAVLERPKRLVSRDWSVPGKHGQRGLKLRSPLRDDLAAIQGVSLEVGCHPEGFDFPARVVLLAVYGGKQRAIARIDINGLSHVNRHPKSGDLSQLVLGSTHFHDTRLHLGFSINELLDSGLDLPVARPLEGMPQDFSEAMKVCGELLQVADLKDIEEPQWQPRQFPF